LLRAWEGFWPEPGSATAPIIELSPEHPGGAALLARVGAKSGLLICAHDGEQWVGALSMHDPACGWEAAGIAAVALAQQAAAALRRAELEEERRRLAEGQRQCVAELGYALGSALTLDELLAVVCRSSLQVLGGESCLLFLGEEGGPQVLRAQEDHRKGDRPFAREALAELSAQIAASGPGPALWETTEGPEGPPTSLRDAGVKSAIGVPLTLRGERVGSLAVLSETRDAFSAAQGELLTSLAAQASVAIENLRLFEDAQRRLLEMAGLTWVSGRVAATLEAPRIAAVVAHGAASALGLPRMALLLEGPGGELGLVPGGQVGLPDAWPQSVPAGDHMGTQALGSETPVAVEDAEREGRADDALVRWLGARAVVCAPVLGPQGLRGILAGGDSQPRSFRTHMVALLSAYANQAALALQSALLHQGAMQHMAELAKLSELAQELASAAELAEMLSLVLNHASELLEAPVGSIMLLDPESRELVVKATLGMPESFSLYRPLKLNEGLAGRAAQSGTALVSADVTRDGRFKYRESAREAKLRTGIAAPLVARGRTIGVINLYRKSPREFTEEEVKLLTAIANTAAVVVENAHLREEAQERAQFFAALMSEINHRVRNTLQAVSGLLQMELTRPQARSAEEALRRAIARLQTVGVVHELMEAREFRSVDVKQAARQILELTRQAMPAAHRVEARVTGARIRLPSQTATGVALVLSELINNALRHGLAKATDGKLTISLAEAGDEVVIQVKDNGVGLPRDFDPRTSGGLGMRIVMGVVEQDLKGRLELESHGGLTARVRFPKQ
jgi:GAF domain-containing protein